MMQERSDSHSGALTDVQARHLFSSPESSIVCLDAEGNILDANPALCGRLHRALPDLKGRPLWELAAPESAAGAHVAVARLHEAGYLRNADLPLMDIDGARLHFEFRRLGSTADGADLIECRFLDTTAEVVAPSENGTPPMHFDGGLLIGREIEAITESEIARTRELRQPLSLLSITIDRIEGSDIGGPFAVAAMRELAAACTRVLRSTDVIGKASGNVFVALLPGTFSKGALQAAERLRTAIAATEFPPQGGRPRRCTVSIGLVTTRTGRTTYAAMRSRADAKRDDARSFGGNRVAA